MSKVRIRGEFVRIARMLFLVLFVFFSVACGPNFFHVVPVTHEYSEVALFIDALSNTEFHGETPEESYCYVVEFAFDDTVEYNYYIESITTTGNAEASTDEHPMMSWERQFSVGMTLIIGDESHQIEFKCVRTFVNEIPDIEADLSTYLRRYPVSLSVMLSDQISSVNLIQLSANWLSEEQDE
jgi:hypothetical protein